MTFIDIHIISYNMYIQYILTDAGCTMLHPQQISGSKVARAQRRGRCGKPNRWTAGASNGCERCWCRPPYSWMLGRVWAWWICPWNSLKFHRMKRYGKERYIGKCRKFKESGNLLLCCCWSAQFVLQRLSEADLFGRGDDQLLVPFKHAIDRGMAELTQKFWKANIVSLLSHAQFLDKFTHQKLVINYVPRLVEGKTCREPPRIQGNKHKGFL